jgi:hypothetical protein
MNAQTPVRRPQASAALPDLDTLSRSELIRMTVELGKDMDNIRTQLANARTKARVDGVFAPRTWYASAEAALRTKGRQLHAVYSRLGELKADRRPKSQARSDDDFFRIFFDLARETLPTEQFDDLLHATNALVDAPVAAEK